MSDKIEDGGPAFPQSDLSGYQMGPHSINNSGMSLRDWFAGQALAGLCVHGLGNQRDLATGVRGGITEANAAYALADAMLKARLP